MKLLIECLFPLSIIAFLAMLAVGYVSVIIIIWDVIK